MNRADRPLAAIHALIEKILARGSAYVLELPGRSSATCISRSQFRRYGKLSRRKIDDLWSERAR
jgi:cysteinyl-tRNA synthetase